MSHDITITLADEVYDGLQEQVGANKISEFIESLLRPLVLTEVELEAAYRDMAADAEREREARDWLEAVPDDALE